jgi:predicted ATPase/5S rRNA maturation endonuclease (ribonuclease M5)
MNDLSNLVVLVGRNSSGKSNILEGLNLLFSYFEIAGGSTPGVDDYVFHNRHIKIPAIFEVTVRLDEKELTQVFPEGYLKALKSSPTLQDIFEDETWRRITIERHLTHPHGNWMTAVIKWGDLPLVKNNAPLTVDEFNSLLVKRIKDSNLLKLGSGKVDKDPPEKGEAGQMSNDSRGPEPLDATPAVSLFLLNPQLLTQILGNLGNILKKRFFLISAIRDVKGAGHLRTPVLDPTVQQKLWQLDQSMNSDDEEKSVRIEQAFQRVTGERLDLVQSQAFTKKKSRIPLVLEGGGIQSSVNLIHTIIAEYEPSCVFGLEEPETHAHPELQRRLFAELRQLSGQNQVFIVTHSPIFVDRMALGDTWLVKYSEGATEVEHLSSLQQMLSEIGARPSDLFFADRVFVVEGRSDAIAVGGMAKALGINLSDVEVIPMTGKTSARQYLEPILRIVKSMVPVYVLLDQDAENEKRKIVEQGLVKSENVHILELGSIEDYYPANVIDEAIGDLDENYGLAIEDSDGWKNFKAGKVRIQDLDFGHKITDLGGGWKTVLAKAICRHIESSSSKIPDEIRQFLRKVAA